MQLTPRQLQEFDALGYVVMPDCFSEEEIAVLRSEAETIYASDRKEVWRETSGAPRTAFAAHTYNEAFAILGRHPRLIEPLEQFFGEPVYMHQFKINAKAAFDGELWQWHQDYGTWKRDDGMPEPRAMNISVFLDEVMPINGPLMFIPKSHKRGTLAAGHDKATTSYPLWTLDKETVTKLVEEGGIVAPKGGPGSAIFFHGTLVHGSPPNMSPWDRQIIYVTYNSVQNAITRYKRPAYIAHRDFTPIDAWEDDAVMRAANKVTGRKAAAE